MRSCWMLESGGNMISLLNFFFPLYFSIEGWVYLSCTVYSIMSVM